MKADARCCAVAPHTAQTPWRRDIYALLACLLAAPPVVDILADLARMTVLPTLPASLVLKLRTLKRAAGRSGPARLQVEYTDLFVGMGRGQIVPYASWYAEGLLMGEPLSRLRSDLAELAIHRRPRVYESEDHAGALCESMLLLANDDEAHDPAGIRRQSRFFHRHLDDWISRFFRDLQDARAADFYRCVGAVGECFIQLERRFFQPRLVKGGLTS